jgi:multiple sugar transport system ATP-binding protein
MHLTSGAQSMIAKIDSKTQAKTGEKLDVVLDMEKAHLFDLETEKAIF